MKAIAFFALMLFAAFIIPNIQGAKYCKCSVVDAHGLGHVVHVFKRERICGWLCGCKRALSECIDRCQRKVREWYCHGNCDDTQGKQIRGHYDVGNNRRPTKCGSRDLVEIKVCGSSTGCT